MKVTRYLLITAGIVAVLAVVAWVLRDNLIQRLSTPILKDYGVTITDVSLDALAASDATISYLELIHDKGTSVVIEDLTLPLATSKSAPKTYRARKVSIITATRTDGAPFEMADLVRQFLSLPAALADSIIIVDEFNLAPYPELSAVRWEIGETEQRLDGTVESVGMSMLIARRDSGDHDISFLLQLAPASIGGHILSATLSNKAAGLALTGNNAIHLQTWQPLARLTGIIPQELEIASGMADLAFDVAIPNDPAQAPTLAVSLAPTSPARLNYGGSDVDPAAILVQSAGSAEISATFPETDWSLALAEASLLVSYGDWTDIPLAISDVACEAGATCAMQTRVAMSDAGLPVGTVAKAEVSSAQQVQFLDTGIRIDVQPGASLKIDALAHEDVGVERLEAQLASVATFEVFDAGWRILADSVDMEVDALSLGETLSVSAPLFLENVAASEQDGLLTLGSGVYAPSARAIWNNLSIALPGFTGRLSLNGEDVAADLKTVGLWADSTLQARHSLSSDTGHVNLGKGAISFGSTKLSDRVSPWSHDGDIVAGTVSFESVAKWARDKSRIQLDARASITASQLAGYFGETAFSGVSSQFDGAYQDGTGFKAEPSTATAELIEIGVPLENVEADYRLDLNTLSADVTRLSMSAFGGVVSADPFSFRTNTDVNTVTLNTDALDLSKLLSLDQFEALEMTGSVAARLPIAVQGDFFTIENGVLSGNPPGGVIRYKQEFRPDEQDISGLGFAQRVLSNFEYETLASDVSLGKDGDLILKLKLTGRNPDLEEKRPVVLNVVVENNIPQMLRSLRAARAVEDVLEKQMNR
jgi:hypothetical protein